MEMAGASSAIIGFLLLTSALVFILGLLSSLLLRVMNIQGLPKLWIYALLLAIPLAYPIQTLLPDPIRVPVSQKTWRLLASRLPEANTGEKSAPDNTIFTPENTVAAHRAEGRGAVFDGEAASDVNSAVRPVKKAWESPVNWKLMATLVWLMGSLYFLLRLAVLVYFTNRFSRRLEPAADPRVLKLLRRCTAETGLRRIPRLYTLDRLPAPMAMGFFKPGIVIPKRLLKHEFREGLRFALLHELKHVHQHHNWWLLLESVIGAAYFFHPVILWAKRRMREEMEVICDSHVVRVTNKSLSYADFLLHEIWRQKNGSAPVLALPFISGRKALTRRVRSILKTAQPSPFARIRGGIALCFVFCSFISLLLCSVAPSAQDREQRPHGTAPVLAQNHDVVPFDIRPGGTEEDASSRVKRSTVISDEDSAVIPPTARPSHDAAAVLEQRAAGTGRADIRRDDTPISFRERHGYEEEPKKSPPHIPIVNAETPSKTIPGRQPLSLPIQAVSNPRPVRNRVDIILLAQKETPAATVSDVTPASKAWDADSDLGTVLSHMRQGTVHYREERFDAAIADFSKAIEIDPGIAAAYNNRGSAYFRKGRIDKAISDYNEAIEKRPDFVAAYLNRGNAYSKGFWHSRAVSDFNKAVALAPDSADTYYIRGSFYYRTGRIKRAVSDFNKAIGLNPEYIAKMPKGITPDTGQGDADYAAYAAESLKWLHGSLPPDYWETVSKKSTGGGNVNPYQVKKKER